MLPITHSSINPITYPLSHSITLLSCIPSPTLSPILSPMPLQVMLAPDQLSHLSHNEHNHITLARFSSNGKYLVTADDKGVILVWSVKVPRKGSQPVTVKADMFKAIRKLSVGSAYQGYYLPIYLSSHTHLLTLILILDTNPPFLLTTYFAFLNSFHLSYLPSLSYPF